MFGEAADNVLDGLWRKRLRREASDPEADPEQRIGKRECCDTVGGLEAGFEPAPVAGCVWWDRFHLHDTQQSDVNHACEKKNEDGPENALGPIDNAADIHRCCQDGEGETDHSQSEQSAECAGAGAECFCSVLHRSTPAPGSSQKGFGGKTELLKPVIRNAQVFLGCRVDQKTRVVIGEDPFHDRRVSSDKAFVTEYDPLQVDQPLLRQGGF